MQNKKDAKKIKKQKSEAKVAANKSQVEQPQEEPKSSFDFGGLPARDLKKNLGCG